MATVLMRTPSCLDQEASAEELGRSSERSCVHVGPAGQFPGCTATMSWFCNSANCQFSVFTLTTIGWILSCTSMGLVEWRIWYMKDTPLYHPGIACVGIFRVCIYRHRTNSTTTKFCYRYSYQDTFLPFEIYMAQRFLLTASIFGFFGRAFNILALRNTSVKIFEEDTYNSFIVSGVFNIAAGVFILIAVLQNYDAIINSRGITFPPSLQMPFKPDVQEVGTAIQVAGIGVLPMLLTGMFSLFYKCPLYCQVHPDISET
ncbi:claudin-34 [Papio anubis]|uniref:claudin-34 n=1 Tax=Papio anubis TaxID=9555 RepID=UPI0004F223D4|nr:claudin-34 [Papio anubis]